MTEYVAGGSTPLTPKERKDAWRNFVLACLLTILGSGLAFSGYRTMLSRYVSGATTISGVNAGDPTTLDGSVLVETGEDTAVFFVSGVGLLAGGGLTTLLSLGFGFVQFQKGRTGKFFNSGEVTRRY